MPHLLWEGLSTKELRQALNSHGNGPVGGVQLRSGKQKVQKVLPVLTKGSSRGLEGARNCRLVPLYLPQVHLGGCAPRTRIPTVSPAHCMLSIHTVCARRMAAPCCLMRLLHVLPCRTAGLEVPRQAGWRPDMINRAAAHRRWLAARPGAQQQQAFASAG
jgi:hypothetical protein